MSEAAGMTVSGVSASVWFPEEQEQIQQQLDADDADDDMARLEGVMMGVRGREEGWVGRRETVGLAKRRGKGRRRTVEEVGDRRRRERSRSPLGWESQQSP